MIALMIVMLPLRGWVGDAMALSMALGHAETASQPFAPNAAPLRCHVVSDEAAAQTQGAEDRHYMNAGAGHGHLLCDLCNGPVLNGHWVWAPATSHPPQLLPPGSERFASQTARRNVRPPIS
jgi:hypothetical protein